MPLAVKIDLILFWVLLSVVEIREACGSVLLGIKNIIDESLRVEGKFCPSSCVSMLWIVHFVKLVAVIVVSIHRHD